MDKTELYSIKARFSNVINKFDKLKVKLISNGTEFDNLTLQINNLKIKIAALNMQSTIEEFFSVKELLNDIEIYVFDLDDIIDTNPDVEPVVPTVSAIVLSVDTSKLATVSPQNVNDPQNRISSIKYSLKSNNIVVQELTANNPRTVVTFPASLTSGAYIAEALYTYTLPSGNSQFILVSNTVVVEEVIPPVITPTVSSIVLSVDNNKMATVSPQNVNDPQNRISSVKYSLKSNNIVVQELTSTNAKTNITFANSLTAGTYVAEALYTYTLPSGNSQFILVSNTVVVEEVIPPVITPTVSSIVLSVDNNKMATVSPQNVNDPQNRISSVKYSLKSNNIVVQELTSTNAKTNITFANSLTAGTYVAEALYTYTLPSGNSQFIVISNTVVVEDSSSTEVATVYVTNKGSWSTGFNCAIEIVSSTSKDYAGNWELTFDTSVNTLTQWQIITTKIGTNMSLVSGKDWAGKPHFPLAPNGTVSITDVNSSGAPFDDKVMKNALLNGQPAKVIFR